MGAFFTNIQLNVPSFKKENYREKVIIAIIKFHSDSGYIEAKEEEAEKSVIITSYDDSSWLTIYDEETDESQDNRLLSKLVKALSYILKTSALSILVNDSDSIALTYFRNGKSINSFEKQNHRKVKGKENFKLWKPLIKQGFTPVNLQMAWQEETVFVEDTLHKVADILDLNKSSCSTGYAYLSETKLPGGSRKLYFKKSNSQNGSIEIEQNHFEVFGYETKVEAKIDQLNTFRVLISSYGASTLGVNLILAGEAIEKQTLQPVLFRIWSWQNGERLEWSASFLETITSKEQRIYYSTITDFRTAVGPNKPKVKLSVLEAKKLYKNVGQSAFTIEIDYIPLILGQSEISIFCAPVENQEGYCNNVIEFIIQLQS